MKEVAFITSKELLSQCDRIPVVKGRASVVNELISAYNLERYFDRVKPKPAAEDELLLFHSSYYVSYLKQCGADDKVLAHESIECNMSDVSESSEEVEEEQLDYGLGYDCPKIKDLWKFVTIVAGGTLACAEEILNGRKIAINWFGGWHHAQRDEAEGFCYVNDIAIGIQRLRSKFQRILYIDLDVHHGNGVENAFSYTKRIFTLSFHQFESGFYPGSGNVDVCGSGQGRGYSANFPYKSNIGGENFIRYFLKTVNEISTKYKPEVCVVQLGADVCAGDPLGGANVVSEDVGKCVEEIMGWKLPTIFVGGGGYNLTNTARFWTYLTAIICNCAKKLDTDIPDNRYFLKYGPDYELSITRRNVPDLNTEVDLEATFLRIKENLEKYDVHDC